MFDLSQTFGSSSVSPLLSGLYSGPQYSAITPVQARPKPVSRSLMHAFYDETVILLGTKHDGLSMPLSFA